MRPRLWMTGLIVAVIMVGCNRPAATPTPGAASVVPTPNTPTPLPTALPTNTPKPPPVYAIAGVQPVNCRFGPGLIYEVISTLDAGRSGRADGRDYTDRWLYIHDPLNPGGFCWVAKSAIELEGEMTWLPVVNPPLVTVNKVDVYVEPARVTVKCDEFPQFVLLVAEITTNGPTLVNWRWELNTGEASDPNVLAFEEAGTKTVQRSFIIYLPNDYWVKLHINSPNEIIGQANFVANCTP